MADDIRKRILVIDDDEGVVNILRRMIKYHELAEVTSAFSAKQALKILESEDTTFQVIISDHVMPDMQGADLFKIISNICPDTRRMLMTGYKKMDVAIAAVNQGAIHHFILKPWDNDDLVSKIDHELKMFEKAQSRKAYRKTIELQNSNLYKTAVNIKKADEKFLKRIEKKEDQINTLESEINRLKESRKLKKSVFQLYEFISNNLVIEKESLVRAFQICKGEIEYTLGCIAESNRLVPPPGALAPEILVAEAGRTKIGDGEYDIIDSILNYSMENAEPELFAMGLEGMKNSEFEKYDASPGFFNLAVSEGVIDPEKAWEVLDQAGGPQLSDSEIGRALLEAGVLSRVDMSRIMLKLNFIETRVKDLPGAQRLKDEHGVKEKKIQQAFIKQLNEFKETGAAISIGDILAVGGLIDDDTKKRCFNGDHLPEPLFPENNVEPPPEAPMDMVSLEISEGRLEAYIRIPEEIKGPSLAEVKTLLEENGVTYGLVKDGRIEKALGAVKEGGTKILVARGEKPVQNQDAKITYHFDSHYKRPGTIREDGTIDFRKRGEVPFVSEGQLLAEKTPVREGRDGMTVFGEEIWISDPIDRELRGGAGTIVSEDGLKLYAEVEGQPNLDPVGVVTVNTEMTIRGDVNYKTGNVDFGGNVVVTGAIREGFRVTCTDLTVSNIDGGIIEVLGDLNVSIGIVNSKISALGSVRAKYVKYSTIDALGDIMITSEIMETSIFTSGAVVNRTGRITASLVASKQEQELGQVGTESADKSTIRIGVDDHMDGLSQKFEARAREKESKIQDLEKEKKRIEERLFQLHKEAADVSFAHEAKLKQINDSKQKLGASKAKQSEKLKQMKELKEMASQLNEFESQLKHIFSTQDHLMERIGTLEEGINEGLKTIEGIEFEGNTLKEIISMGGAPPAVVIHKKICAGTKVRGTKASLTIKDDIPPCKIVEQSDPDHPGQYKLVIIHS